MKGTSFERSLNGLIIRRNLGWQHGDKISLENDKNLTEAIKFGIAAPNPLNDTFYMGEFQTLLVRAFVQHVVQR